MRSHTTPPQKEAAPSARDVFSTRRPIPWQCLLVPLCLAVAALLSPLTSPAAQAQALPGTLGPVSPDSGDSFPWEASAPTQSGSLNTANGNKLTKIPLVSWTARGGLPVNLSLVHNSQGNTTASELGVHWINSYDIFLVYDSEMGNASVQWGDGTGEFFSYNYSTSSFTPPTGFHDTLTYTTGTGGAITSFTLTRKDGVKFVFNAPISDRYSCASITDRNGNAISISHNSSGFVTGISDPTSRGITFNYTGTTLTSVTDPLSRTFTFNYTSGKLTSIVYPAPTTGGSHPTITLAYNTDNRITSLTDPRGKTSTFSYNSDGSLAWEKDPLFNQTTYTYTSSYTKITDPRSNYRQYNYTSGRVTSVRDEGAFTVSYGYDSANNKTSKTDEAGKVWSYTYDSMGNILTQTDPLSHVTTWTYNSLNEPLTVTTQLGKVTTYTYDTYGNRLTTKNPLNKTWTYVYTTYGQVYTITDPLSHVTTYAYDTDGNVTSVTDPTSRSASATFNGLGWKLTGTVAGLTTTTAYDNLGRVTSVTAPGSRVTSYTYDAAGNKLTVTNNLSQTDTFTYDDDGRLSTHTDALSRVVSFGYDGNSNKTGFTDGRSHTTTYSYTAKNQMSGISYPDSTGESWTYDGRGMVATHTDGRGYVQTDTHDDAGRLTGISYSSGSAASVTIGYDNDNRKTSSADSVGGTISYTYDDASQLTERSSSQGTVDYTYDDAGRKSTQVISLNTTTYGYDSAGRLTSAASPNGTTTYAYDSAGRLVTTTYPSGATDSRTYDTSTGDLSEIWHQTSGGSATIAKYDYTYDGLGRKTYESQPGSIGVAYGYDAAGQLTSETRTGGSAFSASYTYDNAGNRATKTVGSSTETYTYDSANKLTGTSGATSKSYGYDNSGNVTSITVGSSTATLTWDGADRLTGVSGGGLSTTNAYAVNGLGQRVGRTDSTGTATFALSSDAIEANVLGDGTKLYQYGIGLLSDSSSSASRWYHADSLGTTRKMTDSSGSTTASLETDAFGNVVSSSGSMGLFGFAGQHGYQSDPDTGFQRLGHRYYDPTTGRFLSRDRIRDGYNWYTYADNDPVNGVDPKGLGLTSLDGTPEDVELAAECAEDMGGGWEPGTNMDPETPIYRGGRPNPGNLKPRPSDLQPGPNGEEPGVSFGKNPSPGENVKVTVGDLVKKGFRVWNDVENHVSVSIRDLEGWAQQEAQQGVHWATEAIKEVAEKIKL